MRVVTVADQSGKINRSEPFMFELHVRREKSLAREVEVVAHCSEIVEPHTVVVPYRVGVQEWTMRREDTSALEIGVVDGSLPIANVSSLKKTGERFEIRRHIFV